MDIGETNSFLLALAISQRYIYVLTDNSIPQTETARPKSTNNNKPIKPCRTHVASFYRYNLLKLVYKVLSCCCFHTILSVQQPDT